MTANALTALHHPGCYPSDPDEALAFFDKALKLDLGLPPVSPGGGLSGIVAPHLGPFQLGLQSYVAGFQPLMREPLADTYLILGVGHRSRLEWNLDRRDYLTPLGRAVCDAELVDDITSGDDPRRWFSPEGHEGEHSIEFPVLWLQAVHRLHPAAGSKPKPVRFVPLLCGGMHEYLAGAMEWDDLHAFHRLSTALGELLRHAPASGTLRLIVSIDGCHMGPRFQHPFRVTPKLLKETAAWEDRLWTKAAAGKARPFLEWMRVEGNDRYFDGVGALALVMAAGEKAGRPFSIRRTRYDQWFTARDASVVTCSGGYVVAAPRPDGQKEL